MIEINCYCDHCGKKFENEFELGRLITGRVCTANPVKCIDGKRIINAMICTECEKELARWLNSEVIPVEETQFKPIFTWFYK